MRVRLLSMGSKTRNRHTQHTQHLSPWRHVESANTERSRTQHSRTGHAALPYALRHVPPPSTHPRQMKGTGTHLRGSTHARSPRVPDTPRSTYIEPALGAALGAVPSPINGGPEGNPGNTTVNRSGAHQLLYTPLVMFSSRTAQNATQRSAQSAAQHTTAPHTLGKKASNPMAQNENTQKTAPKNVSTPQQKAERKAKSEARKLARVQALGAALGGADKYAAAQRYLDKDEIDALAHAVMNANPDKADEYAAKVERAEKALARAKARADASANSEAVIKAAKLKVNTVLMAVAALSTQQAS